MTDQPPSYAFTLDTEEDIATRMIITCHGCGNDLEVIEIQERPEVAVILSVSVCDICKKDAHDTGYHTGADSTTRGF